MSDPLGLFEEQGSDPLGLFSAPEQKAAYAPQEELNKKTETYGKTIGTPLGPLPGWLKGLADIVPDVSPYNVAGPLAPIAAGVAEQIPAGLQATVGVGAKALGGLQGLATGEKGVGDKYAQAVSANPVMQALTPETKAGQTIAGGIGAGFEHLKNVSNDPEKVKFIAQSLVPNYDKMSRDDQIMVEGLISGMGNALPDLLMVKGAPHLAKSLNPFKPDLSRPAAKPSPGLSPLEQLIAQKKAEADQHPATVYKNLSGDILNVKPEETPAMSVEQQRALEQKTNEAAYPPGEQVPLFGEENLPHENPLGQWTRQPEQTAMDFTIPKEGERPPTEPFRTQDEVEQAYAQKAKQEQIAAQVERLQDKFQVPRSQRGGLNMDIFDPAFEKVKELVNGVKLLFKGDEGAPSIVAMRGNDQVGQLKLSADDWVAPTKDSNLQAAWVDSKEPGLAKEMYKFAATQGDVIPSKNLNAASRAMWDRFEKSGTAEGMKIPRGQRGGLDIKNIGDEAKKFANKLVTPISNVVSHVTVPKDSTEVLAASRLYKKELAGYLAPDPTAEQIITAAAPQPNSTLRFNSLQSGATLTGLKTGSAIIQGIGRLTQNAGKRSEFNIREYIQPVERGFKQLTTKDFNAIADVLKAEGTHELSFSKEELSGIGYTEKQLKLVEDFRAEQDRAFQAQNEALVAQGREPLTKREHYLSSRWSGDYKVPVTENGKLVWYIAEHSKRGAENALQWLKDNGVKVDPGVKVEYRGTGGKERGDVQDAYRTMLGILDKDDPRISTIKGIAEEGMEKGAAYALGQSKHFENKAGVRGFIGDRPWVDKTKDNYEMMRQQFQYMKNAHTWAELQKAVSISKEVLSNPDLLEKQPNNIRYAQEYLKKNIGFGENKFLAGLESQIAEALGRDRSVFYNAIGDMKSLFLATKLGLLNTGYLIANLVQPLWSAAYHADLTNKGFKQSPSRSFMMGNHDGMAGYTKLVGEHLDVNTPFKLSPLGEDGYKYAQANGILSRTAFDEAGRLGRNKLLEAGIQAANFAPQQIEHLSRFSAFMSFAHHLEESGLFKDDKMALFQKAEEYTNAAMVDYRSGERPMVFDKAGAVGSAASALQTFKFNYYNTLHYFGQQARQGNVKPLVTFLAVQAIIGGVISMPFMQEIDDIIDTLRGLVPDAVHEQIKNWGIKKFFAESMGTWANGGMSKLTGAKLDSRFDSGNLQDWSFDGLFPIFSDLVKQGQAVGKFAANPNATTAAGATYAVAPPGAIQGNVETSLPQFKAGTTPEGTVYQNPHHLGQHEYNTTRTTAQEVYKRLGLTELNEGAKKEQQFRQGRIEAENTKRMQSSAENFFDAVVRDDKPDIELFAKRYVNLGGNPDGLGAMIESQEMRKMVPRERLDAIKASTIGQLQKVQRSKAALDVFNK